MNKKALGAIIAVLVLVVGIFAFMSTGKDDVTPAQTIADAISNNTIQRNINAEVALKVAIDEKKAKESGLFDAYTSDSEAMAKYANSLLDKTEIKYGLNLITKENDSNTFKMDYSVGLYYDKKDIAALTAYFQPWELGVMVPKIYDKAVTFDLKEIMEEEGINNPFKGIDISKYIDVVLKKDKLLEDLTKSQAKYNQVVADYYSETAEKAGSETIVVDVYGKEKKVKTNKFSAKMDLSKSNDLNLKIMKVAAEDENLKAFLLDRFDAVTKIALESKDYEKLGATEEEFNLFIEQAHEAFNTDWAKALESGLEKYTDEVNKMNADLAKEGINPIVDVTVYIDENGVLRRQSLEMGIKEFKINVNMTINAFGDDVKVGVCEEDKISLNDIENDPSVIQGIQSQAIKNLGNILSSDAIETLIKDAKANSKMLPDGEGEKLNQMIDQTMGQLRMALPFMLMGIGL